MDLHTAVSFPLIHYGLEIVLDRAPSQEFVSELIAVAAEASIAAIIVAATAVPIHSGERGIQALAEDVFLCQARDQSGTSRDVIIEDDRGNRTVGVIGYHRVQVSRRNIKSVRTSFNQREGKRIRKGYGIVCGLTTTKCKLNADNVGIELMTERDLLKNSTAVVSVRRLVLTLGLPKSSAAILANVKTTTSPTLTEYHHFLCGSPSDLQQAIIETIGTRTSKPNEVWSCCKHAR